jgi:hypothetical protein
MSIKGLFINGVFESVVREILAVHDYLPEQVLYLQPHSGQRIVSLAEAPPSVNDPVRLFISTSADLPTIRYTCEIVGWDNKHVLDGRRREIIESVVNLFQPDEGGLYDEMNGSACLNLLHVWRMRRFAEPFSVSELVKAKDKTPLSPNRTTSGGWSIVEFPGSDWLESRL